MRAAYPITTNCKASFYCCITLKWDYTAQTCDLSRPGYIESALQKFQHQLPTRPQHAPHAWVKPTFGATSQIAMPPNMSSPLPAPAINCFQQIIGSFAYYAWVVDVSMLTALGEIASKQTADTATKQVANATVIFLTYAATQPDAIISYQTSSMSLHIDSDASYLLVTKARSRVGGHYFLSSPSAKHDQPPTDILPHNGPIYDVFNIICNVMSSAAEAECGALFINSK